MEIFCVIILGLCLGSFVTLASYRLPREKPIGAVRSQCTSCGHVLQVRELVPVLSWLWQRGRCAACGARIHWRYPLIEILTAALTLFVFLYAGASWLGLVLLLFTVALLVMIVADFETQLIPDEIQLFLLILGGIYHALLSGEWVTALGVMMVSGGAGLLLHYGYYFLRKRHGLGFGDVKFLFVAGLWLASPQALVAYLFLSGVMGVVIGLSYRVFGQNGRFPFAPALGIALWVFVFFPQAELYFQTAIRQVLLGLIS